jgi:hypothetical protein
VTDNDAKLEQFLRADLPPAYDPLFRITVLARLESRRFRRQVAIMVGVGVAATALVTFNAAAINVWLAEDVTRIALGVVVAAAAVWTLPGRVASALRGFVKNAGDFFF